MRRRRGAVAAALAVALGVALWERSGRGVVRLDEQDLIWNVLAAGPLPCTDADVQSCLTAGLTPKLVYDGRDLKAAVVPHAGPHEVTFLVLRTRVPAARLASPFLAAPGWTPRLELPTAYAFAEAHVAVNGLPAGQFKAGEPLLVQPPPGEAGKDLNLTIELAVRGP